MKQGRNGVTADEARLYHHLAIMCGRVIQSSAPIHLAIVEGMDARDSRVHNYPPRWNAAPKLAKSYW
jgi:hypothetical protein